MGSFPLMSPETNPSLKSKSRLSSIINTYKLPRSSQTSAHFFRAWLSLTPPPVEVSLSEPAWAFWPAARTIGTPPGSLSLSEVTSFELPWAVRLPWPRLPEPMEPTPAVSRPLWSLESVRSLCVTGVFSCGWLPEHSRHGFDDGLPSPSIGLGS